RSVRLDEPAARDLLPAVAAQGAWSDERHVPRVHPHGRAEQAPADVDPLHMGDSEVPSVPKARDDELVYVGAGRCDEVRARLDRRGVDSEVAKHRGRGDEELRGGPIIPTGFLRELDRRQDFVAGDRVEEGGRVPLEGLAERNDVRVPKSVGDLLDTGGQ